MNFNFYKKSIEIYFNNYSWNKNNLESILKQSWELATINYSKSSIKYHTNNDLTVNVDWNNLDQSVYLLYFSSRIAFESGDVNMASNFYRLNRMLNAVDIFYEVILPIHTMFVHPVGTVLGRAKFNDYLVVYQGVTVGSDLLGNFPNLLGQNVLFSNSSILANSILGVNACLSAKSNAYNLDIPADHYLKNDGKIHLLKDPNQIINKYYNV